MSFWGELKRRNVFKVGVAYLIAAWLILQVASITFPALNLPAWALTLVTVFLIIGFIVAIILAWAYEVTPDGVKLTKKVPLADSITHVTGRKLNYLLTGLLIIAVGYIVIDKVYISPSPLETEATSNVTEQIPATIDIKESFKTIAVLPFDDLSPEKDQEYFVLGLSEEILNSLAQIADLTVMAKTSSFSFKGKDKTIQEIASILGVDHILEGSVRKAGNALRITAQLIKAVDGSHLWSKTYDKEFRVEEMFSVQEDIATAVANELKVTLGIDKSFKQLGGTDNAEAYELYLISKGNLSPERMETGEASGPLKYIGAAIALDPEFALAWADKALMHSNNAIFGPANRANEEQDTGLRAALKAIEIEPDLAAGYVSLGNIKSSRGDFIEAELAFRKALQLETEQLGGYGDNVIMHYHSVGYFKIAHELLKKMRQNDPLNVDIRADYLLNFVFRGEMQQAEEEYKRGRALFGDAWFQGNLYILAHRLRTDKVLSRDDITPIPNKIFEVAKEHLNLPEEGLSELYKIYTSDNNLSNQEFIYLALWAAYFGNPEFAMDAMEKYLRSVKVDVYFIWFPVMQDVRKLPRFKKIIKEIGLVDYWNKFGWPDICHQLDDGDFECD